MEMFNQLRSLLRRRDRNQPPSQAEVPTSAPKVVRSRTSWSVTWNPETRGWSCAAAPIRKSDLQRKRERRAAIEKRAAA